MAPSRRKGAPALEIQDAEEDAFQDNGANSPNRRKLRNRMSQRAYRARQAMKIQELEDRLEKHSAPDSSWVTDLQNQNAELRAQLLEIHKKAVSMQISLKALADAAANALSLGNKHDPTTSIMRKDHDEPPPPQRQSSVSEHSSTPPSDTSIELIRQLEPIAQTEVVTQDLLDELAAHQRPESAFNVFHMQSESPLEQVPDHDNFMLAGRDSDCFLLDFDGDLQSIGQDASMPGTSSPPPVMCEVQGPPRHMPLTRISHSRLGPEQYRDITERASPLVNDMPVLKKTNSLFSDHIDALEYCLAMNCASRSPIAMTDKRLVSAIEFMITAFVNISWKPITAWEAYTKSVTAVKDLTAWRMSRSVAHWHKVVPQYRPTKLQMGVPHPSVIDWIPWPSLRDKLIIHHAANPRIDDVISDIGRSYVVQADLSTLVRCPQPVVGFVPIWELVQSIAPHDGGDACDTGHQQNPFSSTGFLDNTLSTLPQNARRESYSEPSLPAASADHLFGVSSLAKAAHKVLRLDQGTASNYRLDPTFFELYPELFDSDANIMAQGLRLGPSHRSVGSRFPNPSPLDASALAQYKDFSRMALECVAV